MSAAPLVPGARVLIRGQALVEFRGVIARVAVVQEREALVTFRDGRCAWFFLEDMKVIE